MKTVYLHIGRHKTGTSSVQYFLDKNPEFLQAEGFIYPRAGRKNIAHHDLAKNLNPNFHNKCSLEIIRRGFHTEIKNYPKIIISSEAFQNLPTTLLAAEFFRGFRIVVIVYLREALDYLQSSYAQKVQNSDVCPEFEQFALHYPMDYRTFINRWRGLGSEVITRLYDWRLLEKTSIIEDFLVLLDIFPVGSGIATYRNRSIGGNLLYLKLLVNRSKLHTPGLYNTFHDLARLDARYASGFAISPGTQNMLRRKFSSQNLFLEEKFGGLAPLNFEHKPPCPDLENWQQDEERFRNNGTIKELWEKIDNLP